MTSPVTDRGERADLLSLRHNRGLSRMQAADAMGISINVLRNAERGSRPQHRHALAIAEFYGHIVTDFWPVAPVEPVE
jgi:transcriptional regulator with XRE-family HTH domain